MFAGHYFAKVQVKGMEKVKRFLTAKAMKVALAVALLTGISVVSIPQKTHAMDCYHWFAFYYKVTGDLDFAELGYNVCMNQR